MTDAVPPDDDADLWLNLKSRLLEARDRYKPSESGWHYTLATEVDFDAAEDNWLDQNRQRREEIDQLMRDWISTGGIVAQTEQARFFASARFDAAADFLLLFSHVKNNEWASILPFPRLPIQRVLEWFLVDWWHGTGQFWFFRQRFYDA